MAYFLLNVMSRFEKYGPRIPSIVPWRTIVPSEMTATSSQRSSTRSSWCDEKTTAVPRADWYDPEIHPKLQSFAAHYGTVFVPTKPYKPQHKGKIENGVKYAKNNALKGHRFNSLVDQNDHFLEWEANVADTRIHGTTNQQVGKHFEQAEKPALLPLPRDRFPSFHEASRVVSRDGRLHAFQ